MLNDESSQGAASGILTSLSTLFAFIGGIGTVAVAIGYLSRYAYFRTLGAGWLMRELTVSEIAWSSVPTAIVIVAMIMYGKAIPLHAPYRVRIGTAVTMTVAGTGVNIFLLNAKSTFVTARWSTIAPLGLSILSLGSLIFMLTTVEALRENSSGGRARALTLASWFVITGLVISPVLFGAITARQRMLDPREFDCVTIVNAPLETCLPAVYLGSERVYCLGRVLRNGMREILVIKWENVRAVHPSP